MTSAIAPHIAFGPEARMLLSCARPLLDPATSKRIRTLAREVPDWDRLISTAIRHGILPLLHDALKPTASGDLPGPAFERLQAQYFSNKGRNVFLADELLKILRTFDRHGLRAVPYKGPVLAAALYGGLAARQFMDLDIMISTKDVSRAGKLLASLGYRPAVTLTRAHEAAFLRRECERLFVGDNKIVLEMSWAFTGRFFSFSPDLKEWRTRLKPVSLGGEEIMTFSPEDLLLILCVHGAKHHWPALGGICDVAKLISVYRGMDWEGIMHHAGRLGGMRMLLLGLCLASDLLGVGLPDEVVRAIQADPCVRSLASDVHRNLFSDNWASSGIDLSALFHLKARERLRDRIYYCLDSVITPTYADWTLLPLPGFLSFLYYALRPMRVLAKYGLKTILCTLWKG